jgi:hypothetical protein
MFEFVSVWPQLGRKGFPHEGGYGLWVVTEEGEWAEADVAALDVHGEVVEVHLADGLQLPLSHAGDRTVVEQLEVARVEGSPVVRGTGGPEY